MRSQRVRRFEDSACVAAALADTQQKMNSVYQRLMVFAQPAAAMTELSQLGVGTVSRVCCELHICSRRRRPAGGALFS